MAPRPARWWLLMLLAVQAAAFAGSGEEARGWLERMMQALRTLDYEGTFVYSHRDGMDSMAIVHAVVDGVERERIYSLDGIRREILRDGDRIVCILPDADAILVLKARPFSPLAWRLPRRLDGLAENYRLEFLGTGRVADRAAVGVAVAPRDGYRYGYRIWLDRLHALPLRVELMEPAGAGDGRRVVEMVLFTELRVGGPIPPGRLEADTDGVRLRLYEGRMGGREPVREPWRARTLPPGFRLASQGMTRLPGQREPAIRLLYSDGLAAVSVYIERLRDGAGLVGVMRTGALSAYGRQVGDRQVTVVGEVPARTVRIIGDGMERME